MPDATITSTASTFGTITGTFAADQSTVTGTVTGIVAGTLTGSVGVPGPQGPTGATGATGAQGPQGDPGAPGQGVPVGGTAGQFLSKIDGTNYNTDWTTVNLSVYAVKANNLSDLADAGTARTNLGLGTLAVVNDAPSDGSQYARKNAAWEVVTTTPDFISSVSSPLSVTTGNLTIDLSGYALLSGATFTGNLFAPTPSPGTDSTRVATTEWVKDLDYAPLNAPQFTGNPRAPTPSLSDDDTSIATTAFVKGQGYITSAALSPYLLSSTAASTYAPIAAALPVGGIATQVLSKVDGTNYNVQWSTITTGTAVWGGITGVISAQLDLQSALNLKANLASPTFTGTVTIPAGASISGYLTSATAASTYYLQTNPDGFITSSALTGYATESFVTSQGYITQATADGLYYPLSGNPSAFIDASALAPYLTSTAAVAYFSPINSPTFTGTPSLPTGTVAVTQAVNDNTTAVATTAYVINQAYARLASPIFSGTPSLPTGTIAVTQTAADSSTKVATTSFVTTADNLKANLASPTFTGTVTIPAGASITGYATESYVTSQGYITSAALTPYLTTATASATYFTIASAASKADLASPTFTGTPTLPTGTIAVTQSPGNNTTAVATTAFVLANAGGTTFASVAETIAGTSTTTSLSPALAPSFLTHPECRSLAYFKQTAVSGSGGVTASAIDYGAREMYLPTLAVGRAGWMYGITGANIPNMSRADWRKVDFSKKIWLSGRAMAYSTTGFGSSYPGDANTFARITLGGYSTNTTGDMTLLGIGWKKQGGLASVYTLTVHNGTTRTDVATSVSATDNSVIDWVLYSEGNGNVSFYINGTLAASTSAGPTGITAAYAGMYREQVEAATTPTARQILETTGGWLYMEA